MTVPPTHPVTLRIGSMISEFAVPGIIPLSRRAGLQFSIIDAEHGSFDLGTIATLAAVARGHSYELLVRVPVIDKAYVGPILDAGASGIVAPMVDTADQARELVRLTRYTPLGERGISLTRAHSGYHVANVAEYLADANSRVKIYPQIESATALSNLEEISRVPGLSGLFLGPNDLLASLGAPGDYTHPVLHKAIALIASACTERGLSSGIITSNQSLLLHAAHSGMNLASVDSDLGYFINGARKALADLNATLEQI